MNTMRSLRALALASTCLLPLAAAAEDDNFDVSATPEAAAQAVMPTHPGITILPLPALEQLPANFNNEVIIGGGWQSNISPRYGRFTGLTGEGGFGIGGFTISGGGAWDSKDPFYYQLQGTDLGIDGRNVSVKVGKQGTWGLNFGYDSIPDDYSRTFQSVWGTGGGLLNGVAPGSINNVTKQLTGKLSTQDVYMRRDILTGGGKYQVGDWTVAAQIRHEHKEGIKENSIAILGAPAPIANNGNITSAALGYFPEPVNYDTDRYDLTAQLAMPKLQVLVGYTYNQFTDNNLSWNGVNPFLFTGTNRVTGITSGAAASSPLVSSRFALPPSNSAHQFKLQLGYNFTPTTRLNANVQYGLMVQNSDYPAATGNANLATLDIPRSSFNGAIQTFHGNVALTARPLPKADVRLSYTIDDRDNISPRNQYDVYFQDAYAAAPEGAFNIPLSYQHRTASIEAGYRILPETKIMVGYAYDETHRTYSSTNNVSQNTFNVKLRSKLWGDNYGSIGYTHEDRRASNYQINAVWNALQIGEKEFYGFVNYYEASRQRDEVKAMLDFALLPNLSASLIGRADYDFYPDSALGLKSNNNFNIGPDVNYRFNNNLSAHAYYNYQMIFFNQNNALKNASCNGNGTTLTTGPAPCLNNGVWTGRNTDETHTAGLGLDWQVIPEKLKISGDYTWSYGRNSYSIMDGGIYSFTPAGTAAFQVAPIPDVKSTLNSLSLRAEYTFTPSMVLWVGYTYEHFDYKDYGMQVGATQFSNAIFSGDANPSYTVHLVMAALRVRW